MSHSLAGKHCKNCLRLTLKSYHCIRYVRDKVTYNCLTNCCVLIMHTQSGALYNKSNSHKLCTYFPSKFYSLCIIIFYHVVESDMRVTFEFFVHKLLIPSGAQFWCFYVNRIPVRSFSAFIWNIFRTWVFLHFCDMYVTFSSQSHFYFLRNGRSLSMVT